MSNIIYRLDEIHKAVAFLREDERSKFYCFYGDLGAGKTTLIKAIIAELGVVDTGSSPTFGLVHEYRDASDNVLAYHLDCYRLEGEEEALDLGIEEILETKCHIFIEWPQRIERLLPPNRNDVYLEIQGINRRKLSLKRAK